MTFKLKSILIVIAFILIANIGFSQNFIYTNIVVKSFKAIPNSTVEIYNKYGKIHFMDWDKDSVKFVINLIIKSGSQEKLDKLKNTIDFDFTGTQYYISAKTILGTKNSDVIANIVKDYINLSGNSVEVSYTVYLPESVNVKVDNKFGDVFMNSLNGNLTLKLSNGDFKGNNLNGNNNIIDVSFGDATFNYVENAKMTISYTDVNIKKAEQLTIDSKYSTYNIDDVKSLKLTTKKDKLFVGSVNGLYGEGQFTTFFIKNLLKEFVFDLKYGNADIDNISSQFSLIKCSSKYTDYKLYFEKQSSYSIDVTYRNLNFFYPTDIAKLQQQVLNPDTKQTMSYGTIGNGDATSKVSINAEYGNLNIFHK